MYLKILGENLAVMDEPPEPSNFIYKNLHIEPIYLLRNSLIAVFAIGGILNFILWAFIIYNIILSNINRKYDLDNDCSNYNDIDEKLYKSLAI